MKRVILFLTTNLAVMLVLSIVLNVLGVGRFLTHPPIDRRIAALQSRPY
jgi:heat shock protein HtpX